MRAHSGRRVAAVSVWGVVMNLDPILQRLNKVKRIKAGVYKACCPAHEDTSPSLEIKDSDDRALVICRAGCTFDEIRNALGMKKHEFFVGGNAPREVIPGATSRDIYEALAIELLTAYIVARDRAEGKTISKVDQDRYRLARDRITRAWRVTA